LSTSNSTDKSFSLKFVSAFKSIQKGFEWKDIPKFAVITGKNGAGKTQLIDALAHRMGVGQSESMYGRPGPQAVIEIDNLNYHANNTFFARSEWAPPSGGMASEELLRQTIVQFNTPPDSWHFSKLAEKEGISKFELSQKQVEALEEILTPTLMWASQSSMGKGPLALLFLAYRHIERYRSAIGHTAEQILAALGRPPWEILDEVMSDAGLPFKMVPPPENVIKPYSLFTNGSYEVLLQDVKSGNVFPYESLSSGEKVIMSMARWLFTIDQIGQHFELLLLDEPDAHLHPSMTRQFIEVLQRTFVEKRGVRVIMSTHSPSTVALVPEKSIFIMERGSLKMEPCSSRQTAINTLTDGFVVAHEGMQIVLCEGENDAPFYSAVWDRVSDEKGNTRGALARSPGIIFMHGKGKDTTVPVVKSLRSHNLSHFHALLDHDGLDKKGEGIHVIDRAALENYLLDPICVWCFLSKEKPQLLSEQIREIKIAAGTWRRVGILSKDTLQLIADAILGEVQSHLSEGYSTELVEVKFTSGLELSYPKWFLETHKNEFMKAFTAAYNPVRQQNFKKLGDAFADVDLVPLDLYCLLQKIQTGYLSRN
jgi:predicted ATPase